MRLARLSALAVLAVCIGLAGCKDPYGACVKADADIAQGISSGMQTITQMYQSKQLSQSEAANIADYLEFANKADEAFGVCAQEAHQAGSKAGAFTACAQSFNASLNTSQNLALLHVSNPQASAQVSVIINGITSGVNSVIAALGGA